METILNYLKETYQPSTLILYGSWADGSNNEGSDFDCLLLCDRAEPYHDVSIVDGIQLDAFVYPQDSVRDADLSEFLQIHDGRILLDETGAGAALKEAVNAYITEAASQAREESLAQLDWCRKMLIRARRGDAEGYFRWHWLLCDSLEIWCGLQGQFYFGPKKTIRYLKETDPKGFALYEKALSVMDPQALADWIEYICR